MISLAVERPDPEARARDTFLGVATTAHRRIASQWEASAIATEMKVLAKRDAGSAYEIDRRRL